MTPSVWVKSGHNFSTQAPSENLLKHSNSAHGKCFIIQKPTSKAKPRRLKTLGYAGRSQKAELISHLAHYILTQFSTHCHCGFKLSIYNCTQHNWIGLYFPVQFLGTIPKGKCHMTPTISVWLVLSPMIWRDESEGRALPRPCPWPFYNSCETLGWSSSLAKLRRKFL